MKILKIAIIIFFCRYRYVWQQAYKTHFGASEALQCPSHCSAFKGKLNELIICYVMHHRMATSHTQLSLFFSFHFFFVLRSSICLSNHLIRPTLKVTVDAHWCLFAFHHYHHRFRCRGRHRHHHHRHRQRCIIIKITQDMKIATLRICTMRTMHIAPYNIQYAMYIKQNTPKHFQCNPMSLRLPLPLQKSQQNISTSIQIICLLNLFVFELTDRTGWSS